MDRGKDRGKDVDSSVDHRLPPLPRHTFRWLTSYYNVALLMVYRCLKSFLVILREEPIEALTRRIRRIRGFLAPI